MPEKTRKYVQLAGLARRYRVSWKPVTPFNAALILKIKELVTVRLVNEIPPKPQRPTGFQKVGRIINHNVIV